MYRLVSPNCGIFPHFGTTLIQSFPHIGFAAISSDRTF
jgi:hypothetical protein